MIVEPLRNQLTFEEATVYGIADSYLEFNYHLDFKKQYIVFGLNISLGRVWVEITDNDIYLRPVPLSVFHIVSGNIPKSWTVSQYREGHYVIRPPELQQEFFIDDLFEGRNKAVKAFKIVMEKYQFS